MKQKASKLYQGRELDKSQGFNSREEYAASLKAQAKTGKLNRKTSRAVKSMMRKKKP